MMNFEILGRPVNLISVTLMIALAWVAFYVVSRKFAPDETN